MGCCSSVSDSSNPRLPVHHAGVVNSEKKSIEIMVSGVTPSSLISELKQSLNDYVPKGVVALSEDLEQLLLKYAKTVMETYIQHEGSNSDAIHMCYGERAFLPYILYNLSGVCRTGSEDIGDTTFFCDFLLCVVDYFRFSKQKDHGDPYLLESPSADDCSTPISRHYNACRRFTLLESNEDSISISPAMVIISELALWCINLAKPNIFSDLLLDSTGSYMFHFSLVWDAFSEVFAAISLSKLQKFHSTSLPKPGYFLRRKLIGPCVLKVISRMVEPVSF